MTRIKLSDGRVSTTYFWFIFKKAVSSLIVKYLAIRKDKETLILAFV